MHIIVYIYDNYTSMAYDSVGIENHDSITGVEMSIW